MGGQGGRLSEGLAPLTGYQSHPYQRNVRPGDRTMALLFKRVKPNTLKSYSCSVLLIRGG